MFLKKEGSDQEILKGWDVKGDTSFESYLTLTETGTYTFIVSSGNQFRTTLSDTIYILDTPDVSTVSLTTR